MEPLSPVIRNIYMPETKDEISIILSCDISDKSTLLIILPRASYIVNFSKDTSGCKVNWSFAGFG